MASNESTAANEAARPPTTEQTPLLGDGAQHATGYPEETSEHGEVPKEASMKELLVIMSSIWLGVFLAALGMCFALVRTSAKKLTRRLFQIQQL